MASSLLTNTVLTSGSGGGAAAGGGAAQAAAARCDEEGGGERNGARWRWYAAKVHVWKYRRARWSVKVRPAAEPVSS